MTVSSLGHPHQCTGVTECTMECTATAACTVAIGGLLL